MRTAAACAGLAAALAACGESYPPVAGMDPDSAFVAVVMPVLRDQCTGCHFPGQPMYSQLPFDDRRVVEELGDGVAVLLEGEGRERVMEWLALAREARADTGGAQP